MCRLQGETIIVLDPNRAGSGWGVGIKEQRQGYFPSDFVLVPAE
jgi:hypothetical protein